MRYHILAFGLLVSLSSFGQNYTYRIQEEIDLRNPLNQALFQSGNELSDIMIEAVVDGEVMPYKMVDYNVVGPMAMEELYSNLQMEEYVDAVNWDADEYYFWTDLVNYNDKTYQSISDENENNVPDQKDSEY